MTRIAERMQSHLMNSQSAENNISVGFHTSVRRFPNHQALMVNKEVFTYAQLSKMSAGISRELMGVGAENMPLVALLASGSTTAYAGVLGILGCGCGYVPLNSEFPAERNARMLGLSGAVTLVVGVECQTAFEALLDRITIRMAFILVGFGNDRRYEQQYAQHIFIRIDDLREEQAVLEHIKPVDHENACYLLFTSGSTGEPKGVPVSHDNVRSYIQFMTATFDVNEYDRCSQMHELTFDMSGHDMFLAWEKGACLCVPSKEEKLLPVSFIQRNKLTVWTSVPFMAAIMDRYGRLQPGSFPDLRYSFFIGESLYMSIAQKWQKAANNSKVINIYGPTEATMAIAYYIWNDDTSPGECVRGMVPIGRIFESQVGRVVREDGSVAATEEEGELCLSGSQVTKGYWHNPEQTAARYVTFADTGETLWYKTGDLARVGKNGQLYCLGRLDNQVKIQGNRVELGEIDELLRKELGTDTVIALPLPSVEGSINGVAAFACGAKITDVNAVLQSCRDKLPKYMVPAKIYFIEEMPLNANGKVDRLQLRRLLEEGK